MNTIQTIARRRLGLPLFILFLLAACAGNPAFRQGLELANQGRLEEALTKFEQASREEPDNREFRIRLLNTREQVIGGLLTEAQREKLLGRFEEAEVLYFRVLAFDRDNQQALAGLDEVKQGRRHNQWLNEAGAAIAANNLDLAEQKLALILQENPRHAGALAKRRQVEELSGRNQVFVPTLRKSFQKPVTLEFVDTSLRQVLEALSRHSGLNFVFDKDVPPGVTVSVFLQKVSVEDALDVILTTNQLKKRILTDTTVLIYPDTTAKQSENQDMVVKNFFLANAEAKQVMTMLKTVLKAKNVFADDKLNLLIMRDTPAMIALAERMVATQDAAEPEVMLDVEIIEIKRSSLLNLGIQFPDRLALSLPETTTLRDLQNLNSSQVNASLSAAILNLKRTVGDTNLLANPRIRTHHREKAMIRIGDRVPVLTSTATSTGFVSESVQYIDVGLKLEVEPIIYANDEISIKLALEVSSIIKDAGITSKAGTTAYQIGTRNASTVLRLKDGETQVLGGLINDQDVKNANRFPGLGDLPILGRLFSSQEDSRDKTELVLSITPRLVRGMAPPAQVPAEFWSGTENEPRLTPLSLSARSPGVAAASAPPPAASAAALPARAAAGATPLLRWEGPAQVSTGERFKLTLKVSSRAAIASFPLEISYDTEVFELVDVVPGPFMAQGSVEPEVARQIERQAGMIYLAQNRAAPPGALGDGSLAEIELRARKPTAQSHITALPATPLNTGRRSLGETGLVLFAVAVTP